MRELTFPLLFLKDLQRVGAAVLLQRGNCTFSEKAANLQQAHAAVGLVANTDEGKVLLHRFIINHHMQP